MTKRSQRLAPIARLAERSEQRAAADCADTRRALERCEQRLQELRELRSEYLLELSGAVALGAARIRELRHFLGRLDAAIVEIEWQVQKRRASFERRQADWLDRRARNQALGEVLSRARAAERRAQRVREDNEVDDRPSRRR